VGSLLIETGQITEELLANGLARELPIPFVSLKTFPFLVDVVRLLPALAAQGQVGPAAELTEKARLAGALSPDVANYLHQLGVAVRTD